MMISAGRDSELFPLLLGFEQFTGAQGANTPIKRLRCRNKEQCGKIVAGLSVGSLVNPGYLAQRADLACEHQPVGRRSVKQRFDAKSVTDQQQLSPPHVV